MPEDTPQTLSAFPDPPNFYTYFTRENQAALAAHRRSLNLGPADPTLLSSLSTDSPLRYLVPPPPPPKNGSYWSFAEFWQTPERHPSLEENGITRLYSDPDPTAAAGRAAAGTRAVTGAGLQDEEAAASVSPAGANRLVELRRLSKSLLLSFLELVGVMAVNPEDYPSKTADLQTILFNMHHLINQYRPHQARETLCLMMEEQLERVRRETEENRAAARRVDEVLAAAGRVVQRVCEDEERNKTAPPSAGSRSSSVGGTETREQRARRRDREGWNLILEAV